MKYYNFHIGDYTSHTSHLSPMEDLAYRRMLDLYYSTEKPLPKDGEAIGRLIRLRDNPIEVQTVLREFFTISDEGWINNGAEKVLSGFRKMAEGGKKGAKNRWSQKSKDGVAMATPSEPHTPPHENPNANHKPITNNHKPITNNHKPITNDGGVGVEEVQEPVVENRKVDEAALFREWYAQYPKQIKELEAQRAWISVKAHRPKQDELLRILQDHKSSKEWQKRDDRDPDLKWAFVPSADKYLLEMRWRDRLTPGRRTKPVAGQIEAARPVLVVDDEAAYRWLLENYSMIEQTPVENYTKPFRQWPQMAQEAYIKTLKKLT